MPDEYISREAALKYIKSEQCKTCSDIGLCGNCAVLVAVKLLEKCPPPTLRRWCGARTVSIGRNLETAGVHGKKVFCHRRIHSIFATTGRQNERAEV